MGLEPPTQMTSGRLTDQYMGIYLQLHNPDGDCHAGTCLKISYLTNWRKFQLCMGPLPPSVGGSDWHSISTSECTSQCWNIYFQPEIPDNIIRRGFKRMKINDARLHLSNLQIFRQSRSLNCSAGLLHLNHSFLLCVYNIQQKRKSVKGFCEKNAKIFFVSNRRKNCNDGSIWRIFICCTVGIRLCAGDAQKTAQVVQKPQEKSQKGCCVKRKMHIDKFPLGDYDRPKLKTL